METVKTKKVTKEKSWVLSGVKLTHEEFVAGIRNAEEGPFFTIEESMEHFEQWMKSREKR